MTTLIAEAGVNWGREYDRLDEANRYIELSKEAGFDAVKFQLYDDAVVNAAPFAVQSYLFQRMLYVSDAEALVNFGNKTGIPVFFTAMYPVGVKVARDAGACALKIRLADRNNRALWDEVNRSWVSMKPVYYSTAQVWDMGTKRKSHVPLFCVPKYPARANDYQPLLASTNKDLGCSLHAPDKFLFKLLMEKKVPAIEMHVRSSARKKSEQIDACVSVAFNDAKQWIEEAKK